MEIFEIYGEQKTLTQWDLGRKMQVNCQCQQLHFANERAGEALVCQVEEAGGVRTARIPDEVLQQSGMLWVYAFVEAEEGYTKHIQGFFVKEKPQPAGYVYTPTQWVKLEDVMARMDALEDKAETDPTVPAWAKNAQKPAYTASEVGARPDTWLPGLAEIGAAPAGYGLGESASYFVTNADNISGSGWYAVNVGTPDANWWLVFASVRNGDYQHQTAYRVYDGETAERYKASGVWGEWEYVNPPMALGVEYRTTEHWNGKAIYTKLLNFGTATDYATVSLGIANTYSIIRQEGTLTNAGVVIPYNEFGGSNSFNILTAVNEGEWRCTFRVGSDYSGRFTLALQVWYVET